MARSPSRSSDGGNSESHTVRAEPRLLKAIEERKHDDAIAILEDAQSKSQPTEHLLRIGLMRAAERNNVTITEYLLRSGAKPDGAPGGRVSPLLRAIEKDHVGIVQLLLKYGANVDVADKQGRTALMTAAWQNRWHILAELLRKGADVSKRDTKGRNVLHNLAADKHCKWGSDVIDLLLKTDIAIDGPDGQDDQKRTPLHWAASTGKKDLCERLLTRPRLRAMIHAIENKDKTALHLAVSHGRDDIVELLIHYKADVNARSDGGWTPLHNACQNGNVRIVKLLLEAHADINARVLAGSTPLHEAASAGHLEVVKTLLERKDCKRAMRDRVGLTPFICAAQKRNKDILNILAPFNQVDTLCEDALGACNGFNGTIVDFGNFHNENRKTTRSIYEILYARDPTNPRKPAFTVLPKSEKAVKFRWIHLPSNNMAWVETLLTKAFVEEGAADVPGFMALERSFSHMHRGQQIHSHYMRPLCQSTPRAPRNHDESDFSDSAEHGPPHITVSYDNPGLGIDTMPAVQEPASMLPQAPKTPARTATVSTDQTDWTAGSGSGKDTKGQGKSKDKHKKISKWGGAKQAGGRGGTETPTKQHSADHHSRPQHQRKPSIPLGGSAHIRSPGSPGRRDPTSTAKGNIFTFMPYLHYETNTRRQEMQDAIERAKRLKERDRGGVGIPHPPFGRAKTYDEMLLRAHLTSTTNVSLHIRRTLDQFFYHNIDTQSRDTDQVVYRYQCHGRSPEELGIDPKIFMVDQLWMWVLGKDLIVTAFPQRWQQPKNDPLNVLDGIIEDVNSKTREPVRSVYDLSIIITSRCSGVFDRHHMGNEDYQFLDMFESSIGDATELETLLFQEFNTASAQASAWLQHHRRANRFSRHLEAEFRRAEHLNKRSRHPHDHRHALADPPIDEHLFHDDSMGPAHTPLFVDKLLDIGMETDLLAETKDIRDELNMISKVLEDQRAVLPDLETGILDIYREEHKSQLEVKRRFKDQLKTIDIHLKDIKRMDMQAERIYKSITDLLDLKQKHANAFEARFARDRAADTARQSQTIMVFTIVTIIFLPLSFIASIFTINIREFPHALTDESQPSLPFEYVSKYMFGIGFAISIPLIAIAVSVDEIGAFFRDIRLRFSDRKRRRTIPQSPLGELREEKFAAISEYSVDTHALEQALSAGRSTARGRRSIESYLSRGAESLLPVTSRGTTAAGKHDVIVTNSGAANGNGRRESAATGRRPDLKPPVERVSTGFKLRGSFDIERGG